MQNIYNISQSIPQIKKAQILDLVTKNAFSISAYVFKSKSAIYDYLATREVVRTARFLDRIGYPGADGANLIVSEDNGIIIGSILYHCTTTNDHDISIASTIVDEQYRGQGVLKNMMDVLKCENESIMLTCFVEKVPIYEKLGFKVMMEQGTQICMFYGNPDDGDMYSVDDDYIDQHSAVQQEFSKFQSKYPSSWNTIWKQVVIDCNVEIHNAKQFINCLS